MKSIGSRFPRAAVAVSLALCAGAVPLARGETAEAPATDRAASKLQTPAATRPSAFGSPVDAQRLTGSRGGASTASTQVEIGGVLKDASATNVTTGNNAIREGSFSNAVGFNTVIQNSGANVLIQNSMTVNVQFNK